MTHQGKGAYHQAGQAVRTHMVKGRTDSIKLSSDLYIPAVACVHGEEKVNN